MGRIARVIGFERLDEDDEKSLEVKIDPEGGALLIVPQFAMSGTDAPPLAEDYALTVSVPGDSGQAVIGYLDSDNEGVALGGEHRIYARDPDGTVAIAVHLKGDGTIEFGADTDNLVRYSELETAFELLKTQLTTNLAAIATAINAIVPGSYTVVPLTAALTLAKIEEFLAPEWEAPDDE